MACTEAVETVIDEHYGEQTVALADGSDQELRAMIDDYRSDEVEHREAATAHTGGGAFPIMEAVIRAGCRAAIAVAKRI
jgi:ubiquinone biosynthesis monooxygenase Coq7